METIPPYIWLIALTVGVVLLGAAMVFGTMRNKKRTTSEKIAAEVGTKRVYQQEDRDAS